MTLPVIKTVLACLVVHLVAVQAYPSGAPEAACKTMVPTSHGNSTAKGKPPYQIILNPPYPSNNPGLYNVTLVGVGGAQFKGFLIEAKIDKDPSNSVVGFFESLPPTAKIVCAKPPLGNAVTHTSNSVKSSVNMKWREGVNTCGSIVFHMTIVRGGSPSTKVDPSDYFMDRHKFVCDPNSNECVSKSIVY